MMESYTAQELLNRRNTLRSARGTWDTVWQNISDYVMPRKSEVQESKTADIIGFTDHIYDTEAIQSNDILASGQLDFMVTGKWFEFMAPNEMLRADQEATLWYKRCSEIVLEILNDSNFPTQIHEFFHERGGFGTAHIHIDEDEDEVWYDFEFTARQAVEKFGEDKLSREILEAYNDKDGKSANKKFKFVHGIFPRKMRDITKMDGKNKRFASYYIEEKACSIVREGGFDEQPFAVSRFLKWNGEVYGYCPSILALPMTRQVNFIERQMDALVEVLVNPRMLVPDGFEDSVDYRAGGVTVFDPNNPNAIPREWASVADFQSGITRAEQKRDRIRQAYFVDLFQLLTTYDEMKREKTAFEVQAMLSEKIKRISPTFDRTKSEVFRNILNRTFAIAFRKQLLPAAPPQVFNQKPGGEVTLTVPKVNYTSKLAMAQRMVENDNFMTFMGLIEPLLQFPEAVAAFSRNYNLDRIIRGMGLNQGIQADFHMTADEMEEAAAAQQAAMQQQQALEAAQSASQSMANMAKVPGAAEQMAEMMPMP
jgi:hypothetical protein